MTLDLNNWEARLVLEAMRSLEAQWNAVIDGTEDEDVQSEYGNDLAQLEMTRERIEAAACVEFGSGVRVFSRELVGLRLRGVRGSSSGRWLPLRLPWHGETVPKVGHSAQTRFLK